MAPTSGTQIGTYRLLSPLGRGGMGEVFRAHDTRLRRDVALKFLPRDLANDPDRRARLLREARAAAALNHPNICTIYDVGEADGEAFIAMELVEGRLLSARLLEGQLAASELLNVALQLADAVALAHDRGVVHRDLKSANVMISAQGRVKVLDFGLAKQIDEHASELTTAAPLTEAHAIVGTLPYMSPEQLRGQTADTRSDIWSLGVMLCELAGGARPFAGNTSFELGSAIMHADPMVPAGVPAGLAAIIRRCLEREPTRRYQRAGELRAALETVAAHRADGGSRRPVRGVPRGLAVATVSVAAIVGLGFGVWKTAGYWRSTTDPQTRITSLAVLPLDNLSGNAGEEYFVAGIHEGLITDLARIGLQKVIAKSSVDAFKGTKRPLRDIGRELGVDAVLTGSIIRQKNRVQITAQLVSPDTGAVLWANRYERSAADVLSLQSDVVAAIAREVRATLTPEESARLTRPRAVNPAAHDAYLKGRSLLAAFITSAYDSVKYSAAVAEFERAIGIDPAYAPPYAGLSLTHLTASQISILPPKSMFPKAKAAAEKAVSLDDGLAESHAVLGEVLTWYDWDWPGAEREIQRALELNPDSVDALRASEVFATLVARRFEDAARTSDRILMLDPLNPFSRVQPAWVAFYSRRFDDSIRYARNLRELWPNHLMAPIFLASNHAVRKIPAEVADECAKLMAILAGAYVMRPIAQCAWAHAAAGNTSEARRLLRILENPPAGQWLDPAAVGQVYGALGEIERALAWYRRGLNERSPMMIYMNVGAQWDPARSDPRFQAMLREMNFPN